MALLRGGDEEDAYIGAILLAEGLRTVRDWEVLKSGIKRVWTVEEPEDRNGRD